MSFSDDDVVSHAPHPSINERARPFASDASPRPHRAPARRSSVDATPGEGDAEIPSTWRAAISTDARPPRRIRCRGATSGAIRGFQTTGLTALTPITRDSPFAVSRARPRPDPKRQDPIVREVGLGVQTDGWLDGRDGDGRRGRPQRSPRLPPPRGARHGGRARGERAQRDVRMGPIVRRRRDGAGRPGELFHRPDALALPAPPRRVRRGRATTTEEPTVAGSLGRICDRRASAGTRPGTPSRCRTAGSTSPAGATPPGRSACGTCDARTWTRGDRTS